MINKIGIFLFFLISLLPGIDWMFDFVPTALGGVEVKEQPVELSPQTFWTEQWQQFADSWWSRSLGLRGIFIRTDNQLDVSLFDELGSTNRKRVTIGKENTLFETIYISAYQQSSSEPPSDEIKEIIAKIKTADGFFKSKGIPLIILISPSKAATYPERIPERFKPAGTPLREYRAFIDELKANGLTFFDSREWLTSHTDQLTSPIFYKTGTHWSQESGCKAVEQVFSLLGSKLNKPLRSIDCSKSKTRRSARDQDGDLLELTNIWAKSRFVTEPYLYPEAAVDKSDGKFVPRIVLVGSSFLWTPISYIQKFRLASSKSRLYYYFRTRSINMNQPLGPIDPNANEWFEEVQQSDAVIVEINESGLTKIGFGFFEALETKISAMKNANLH